MRELLIFSKSEKKSQPYGIENCGHSFTIRADFLSKNSNLAELMYSGEEMKLSMKFYFEKIQMKC